MLGFVGGLLLMMALGQGDTQQSGETVYKRVSESVLLLEGAGPDGQPVGAGSGFLVAADSVLTNAHVATKGFVSVRLGTVLVPCVVERQDLENDLALCKMAGRSRAAPVTLADAEPTPGSVVFAIGNPRGLERSISQGLFTGLREIDGRTLAQISAPISPGSSGGPVLNASGELVGVAVGSLTSAQNLNFAVPLAVVRAFLAGDKTERSVSDAIATAKRLVGERDQSDFSAEEGSEYQRLNNEAERLLLDAISRTSDLKELSLLSGAAKAQGFQRVRVDACRKAVRTSQRVGREQYSDLADALYMLAVGPDAPELKEAEDAVTRAIALGGPGTGELVLLGHIQSQAARTEEAYSSYQKALALVKAGETPPAGLHYCLFDAAFTLGRSKEATIWADKVMRGGSAWAWEWERMGAFYDGEGSYQQAGEAYARAHALSPKVVRYPCEAAGSYYMVTDVDRALALARKCIELGAIAKGDHTADLAMAHRLISDLLNGRGVYEESAVHAKQAIALEANNPWSYHNLATALNHQQRFAEATTAAKSAIRYSDGKYAAMHFELGTAHFGMRQFMESAQAFEKAAELDPKDPASAHNVAAAYYNLNYWDRALHWYRETARRDPGYEREKVQKVILLLAGK